MWYNDNEVSFMKYYKSGDIIKVKVTAVEPYGAFVRVDNEYTGLIHISEITGKFIDDINSYIKIDDILEARIIDVDTKTKHIRLTLKKMNFNRKNEIQRLTDTDLGFLLLEDLLPKWIEDKTKEIKKCK